MGTYGPAPAAAQRDRSGPGGAAAWFASQRDDHGYAMTATARASTPTSALVSERFTLDGTRDADVDWAGRARVTVRGTAGAPVFVGIARYEDAFDYLGDTAHDRVLLDEGRPYDVRHPRVDYRRVAGDDAALPAPADETFWVASAQGAGWQSVTWNPTDGNWVVVVANADGSAGVHAMARIGVRSPLFDWVPPVLLGGGVLALGLGGLLIVVGAPPRRA